MDANPPISADELKAEFDKLSEIFHGHSTNAKFIAASEMMVLISRYLSNNIKSLDTCPITTILEEYARIANGAKPEFIKSQKEEGGGRPVDITNQIHSASIVVAIDILSKYDYSVSDSIELVAKVLGRDEKKIKQLRADFNRREKHPDVEAFKRQQSSLIFASKSDAENHVSALLAMVKANKK